MQVSKGGPQQVRKHLIVIGNSGKTGPSKKVLKDSPPPSTPGIEPPGQGEPADSTLDFEKRHKRLKKGATTRQEKENTSVFLTHSHHNSETKQKKGAGLLRSIPLSLHPGDHTIIGGGTGYHQDHA